MTRGLVALLAPWLGLSLAIAGPIPPAYEQAARDAGVPAAVLYALALQESAVNLNGRLRPWPWTLNVAGQPLRFARQTSACQALRLVLRDTDPRRVDIGLGQINWGYHRQRFASPCAALDPYRNLAVAAALLQGHYRASGDWVLAAGRYHRPAGGAPAARYRVGFARHLARLQAPATELPLRSHR